ncbi:hypothetical protein [Halobacteriovorax sp. ZH2_bin.1]|uniref:hypothetical protein n=1 Tax=unclassified Halobacteriovorax TaxID=2639665 RepID=UPI00371AD2CB
MKMLVHIALISLIVTSCSSIRTIPTSLKEKGAISSIREKSISVSLKSKEHDYSFSDEVAGRLIRNNYNVSYAETLNDAIKNRLSHNKDRYSTLSSYELRGTVSPSIRYEKCGGELWCLYRRATVNLRVFNTVTSKYIFSDSFTVTRDLRGVGAEYWRENSFELRNEFFNDVSDSIFTTLNGKTLLIEVPFVSDSEIPDLDNIYFRHSKNNTSSLISELQTIKASSNTDKVADAVYINTASLYFINEEYALSRKALNDYTHKNFGEYYTRIDNLLKTRGF